MPPVPAAASCPWHTAAPRAWPARSCFTHTHHTRAVNWRELVAAHTLTAPKVTSSMHVGHSITHMTSPTACCNPPQQPLSQELNRIRWCCCSGSGNAPSENVTDRLLQEAGVGLHREYALSIVLVVVCGAFCGLHGLCLSVKCHFYIDKFIESNAVECP